MKGGHLLLVGAAVVALAYLVFSFQPASSRPKPMLARSAASSGVDLPDDLVVGDPVEFGNLAVFPVSSKSPKNEDRFITLDEGLETGTVEIVEKSAVPAWDQGQAERTADGDPISESTLSLDGGNDVNELMVINRSEKPLYLMPGEIIVGGNQDRTIGEELVVAPDGQPIPLNVFCVEHARWGARDEQDYANLLLASELNSASAAEIDRGAIKGLAEEANDGKFIASGGTLSKPVRLAVQQGNNQTDVWEEVAKEIASSKVEAETGTFIANYSDAESAERLTPYMDRLHDPVAATNNVVGVIVAVNGEMESLDVFQSTPLFKKLWPKLLKSYALDASNAPVDEAGRKTATRETASAFLREIAQANASAVPADANPATSAGESERVLVFSAREQYGEDVGGPSMMSGMGGMGGFGGSIHSSGFSK
jgi:hypothetical protein